MPIAKGNETFKKVIEAFTVPLIKGIKANISGPITISQSD